MIDAIRYCLANLANFSGRDPRATFWPYTLALIVINLGVGALAAIFAYKTMREAVGSLPAGSGKAEFVTHVFGQTSGPFTILAYANAAVSITTLLLFAAAFTRRLRDAGLPALLVAIPVAATLFDAYLNISTTAQMVEFAKIGDFEAIGKTQASAARFWWAHLLGYVVVIICGLFPTRGA